MNDTNEIRYDANKIEELLNGWFKVGKDVIKDVKKDASTLTEEVKEKLNKFKETDVSLEFENVTTEVGFDTHVLLPGLTKDEIDINVDDENWKVNISFSGNKNEKIPFLPSQPFSFNLKIGKGFVITPFSVIYKSGILILSFKKQPIRNNPKKLIW